MPKSSRSKRMFTEWSSSEDPVNYQKFFINKKQFVKLSLEISLYC